MFYKKEQNEAGKYVNKDGVRFDILQDECPKKVEEQGTGKSIEVTCSDGTIDTILQVECKVVVLEGWYEFPNVQTAKMAFGLEKI